MTKKVKNSDFYENFVDEYESIFTITTNWYNKILIYLVEIADKKG